MPESSIDMMPVRALTLWAEWIPTFIHMGKRVENRGWPAPKHLIGNRIALHTGAAWPGPNSERWINFQLTTVDQGWWVHQPQHGLIECASVDQEGPTITAQVARGCIELLATVKECVHIDKLQPGKRWAFGPWCWLLDDVRRLADPIPARGKQGLWWASIPAYAIESAEAIS